MAKHRIASAVAALCLGLSGAAFAQVGEEPQPAQGAAPAPAAEPAQPEPAPPAAEPMAPESSPDGDYVVQEGDTLSAIAEKLTGSEKNWQEIARENGITDPTKLQVGSRLRIPAALRST